MRVDPARIRLLYSELGTQMAVANRLGVSRWVVVRALSGEPGISSGIRVCQLCGETKPIGEFNRAPKGPGARNRRCVVCEGVKVKRSRRGPYHTRGHGWFTKEDKRRAAKEAKAREARIAEDTRRTHAAFDRLRAHRLEIAGV